MSDPWSPDNPTFSSESNPNVTLSIGSIQPTDLSAKFTGSLNLQYFTDYVINSDYELDNHIYGMPVTSPGGDITGWQIAVVQLAAPTLFRIIDWTACRIGVPPIIPDPNLLVLPGPGGGNITSVDVTWINTDQRFQPGMQTVGDDGVTIIYRISGTYVYISTNPSKTQYVFTRPPWLNATTVPLTTDMLQKGLI